MIDTHCHLLPGLDDGPSTIDESVALAVVMVDQGVTSAVCTPHLSREFPVSVDAAHAALETVEREFEVHRIDLSLTLAAEVSDVNALTLSTAALLERSIGGRHLLVELGPYTTLVTAEAIVRRLEEKGLVAIVAHPERSLIFQRDPAALDAIRGLGGLVQVVAASIAGRWGDAAEQAAWTMLAGGRVDLVASDAHGVARRRCWLREAGELVRRRIGVDAWTRMSDTNPGVLLKAAVDG